ncbi:MAG: hypothetical protein ACK53Y_07290, partial [bacterium]
RARVGVPHHLELHPFLVQVLREVSHEFVNLGFAEQLLWLLPADTPADRELDGSLPVVVVIQGHQSSECQAPLGCLSSDIFPAEVLIRQVQPGGPRHPCGGQPKACRLKNLTWLQLTTHPYPG